MDFCSGIHTPPAAFSCGWAYRFNAGKTRWAFGIGYLQKDYTYKSINLPKSQFTADAGLLLRLLSDRGRNVVLSGGFSAAAGYETTN